MGKRLNRKDLQIVTALDRLGSKASTEKLSRALNIPARTIRYRLAKLKERGFLQPISMKTHERKLGLGESILVVQENRRKSILLHKLIERIPYFYWSSSTYGKYNGYLIHSVFSLASSETNLKLLEAMQENDLLLDYYIFEISDYEVRSINLDYFSPKNGWKWDWDDWVSKIRKKLAHNNDKRMASTTKEKTLRVHAFDFDYKDVSIMKHLLMNGSTTLKKLGSILGLSEAQISKRVMKLENKGIIKGYKSVFNPHPGEALITFYCFIETSESAEQILECFHELPHSFDILMESTSSFCLRLAMTAGDFNSFLRGFDSIKPYMTSYFFQFTQLSKMPKMPRIQQVYSLFNKDKGCWETPIEEYVAEIARVSDRLPRSNT